jgi:predicted Zn-dependent peptidase
MSRLGKGELLYDELLTVDDILSRVDAVTPDDIRDVAAVVLEGTASLAVIGPFADHDFSDAVS